MRIGIAILSCGLGLAACVSTCQAADKAAELGSPDFVPSREHPYGWRGDGSGCFPGATNPPTKWDVASGENVRWKIDIDTGRPYKREFGMGWQPLPGEVDRATKGIDWLEGTYSSPVLLDDRIITLSEPNWVICVNKADGKELWRQQVPFEVMDKELAEHLHRVLDLFVIWRTGYTMPTPVTDNESIWVVFGFGPVARFDRDGKRLWTGTFNACRLNRDGTRDDEHRVVGATMPSPVLCKNPAGDGVDILVSGGVETDAFVGWNADTGERLWSVAYRGYGHHGPPVSGGTPVVMRLKSATVVVTGEGWVIDVRTGKVLQQLLGKNNRHFTSPVVRGDCVVVRDGVEKRFACFRLGDDGTTATELWTWQPEGEPIHNKSPVGSPLWLESGVVISAASGHGGAPFVILDPVTGAKQAVLPETVTGQSSSPTLAGGLLYVMGSQAAIVRLSGGNSELVGSFKSGFLGKPNHHGLGLFNSPVFEGNRMYYRDLKALYCIEEKE